jgi:hypothetical protein
MNLFKCIQESIKKGYESHEEVVYNVGNKMYKVLSDLSDLTHCGASDTEPRAVVREATAKIIENLPKNITKKQAKECNIGLLLPKKFDYYIPIYDKNIPELNNFMDIDDQTVCCNALDCSRDFGTCFFINKNSLDFERKRIDKMYIEDDTVFDKLTQERKILQEMYFLDKLTSIYEDNFLRHPKVQEQKNTTVENFATYKERNNIDSFSYDTRRALREEIKNNFKDMSRNIVENHVENFVEGVNNLIKNKNNNSAIPQP